MKTKKKKNIRYIANCYECGEHFFTSFISQETDPSKLKKQGMKIAAGWGAECLSVEKDTDQKDVEQIGQRIFPNL